MIAYTDGSYNRKKNSKVVGYATVFIIDETDDSYKLDIFYGVNTEPEYAKIWNVGGELFAAFTAIDLAKNQYHANHLTIYHDYMGISAWAEKTWKANVDLTKAYQRYVNEEKATMPIRFHHVKGHSGDALNEVADYYANLGIERNLKEQETLFKEIGVIFPKSKRKSSM